VNVKSEEEGMDRRGFLKTGLQVTAGAVAAGSVAGCATGREAGESVAAAKKTIKLSGEIPKRRFGKTGHVLPILGHGGSAMVDVWSAGYNVKLESYEKREAMVRRGYDKGIRYFDTARVYSESEGIMGRALKNVRENVFIASKVADPRPDHTRESVEKSLSELQTDYVDLMQIHSPAIERVGSKGGMKIYEELAKLRDEGMIRHIGLTTHVAYESVYEMIDTEAFDTVLLARGYVRKGMTMMLSNPNMEWNHRCTARAHELDMAIIMMKVMGLNMLGRGSKLVVPEYDEAERAKLPAAAIRWAMQDERISMLNIGMSVPDDVDACIATVTGESEFSDDDSKLLADYSAKLYESEYVKAMPVV